QAHALAIITLQRTALFTALQRRRRDRAPAPGAAGSLADALVTDALIVRAEADLRWLDLCEQRVASQPAVAHGTTNERSSS
ncbi:MAG TPA: hypothetical protein VMM60_10885, partial [Ilumatobacter sp.]|nr:hypothetical protein [Ilumatobacter sp.]